MTLTGKEIETLINALNSHEHLLKEATEALNLVSGLRIVQEGGSLDEMTAKVKRARLETEKTTDRQKVEIIGLRIKLKDALAGDAVNSLFGIQVDVGGRNERN